MLRAKRQIIISAWIQQAKTNDKYKRKWINGTTCYELFNRSEFSPDDTSILEEKSFITALKEVCVCNSDIECIEQRKRKHNQQRIREYYFAFNSKK